MITPAGRQRLLELGIEESKIDSLVMKAMLELNMTEAELIDLIETDLRKTDTSSKTKAEAEASGEASTAFIFTVVLTVIGYFIAWFFYKDKDGWLFPYLSSFLYLFWLFPLTYQIMWYIVHGMNSIVKSTLSAGSQNRYY